MKKSVPSPPVLRPHPDLTFEDSHRYASHHLLFALRDTVLAGDFDRPKAIERIRNVQLELAGMLLESAIVKSAEHAVVPAGTGPWANQTDQ